MIMNASYNAASGVIGKFVSMDGTREIDYSGFNGSPTNIKNLTDSSFDPNSSVLNTSELGWAVLDLGEQKLIDKIVFSLWHDWWFGNVKVQVANNADFSDAVTVYEAESMQNVASGGSVVKFAPTNARYVRVTNNCKGEGQTSIFTEIQVFTHYSAGDNLIADTESWTALKDANFTNDGNVIRETSEYQTSNWDKAYSYDKKTYENFMIDATMSIDVADPAAWGYIGVQIFRQDTNVVQSNTGKGIVVGIEPKGRALIWDGSKEIAALDANIVGWQVGKTFDLKLIVYEGMISLAIDGRPVLDEYYPEYVGASGYISIHSGLLPMTVSMFGITELNEENFELVNKGEAIESTEEVKIAVERYVAESEVIRQLGNTVTVFDTAGKSHTVGVTWVADGYDRTKTGNFDFIGTLNVEDIDSKNLSNVYKIKAKAIVFIRPEVDGSVVENLINIANGLNSYEYTEDSWQYLQQKVEAAQDILNNPFLVQSDVNVGMFQLYDAIYKYLVYVGNLNDLETALAVAKSVSADNYTEYSYAKYNEVVVAAEEYFKQSFKTFAGVEEQVTLLNNAKKLLVEKANDVPTLEIEKPEIEINNGNNNNDGATQSCAGGIATETGVITLLGLAALKLKKGKKD